MSRPFELLERFVSLPRERRRRLIVAAAVVTRMALALRFSSFQTVFERLQRTLPEPDSELSEPDRHRAELDGWAVRAVSTRLPWASCLRRSLALWWMLRRQGIASEIRFGARAGEPIEAHAWLEVEGAILSDALEPPISFRPLVDGAPDRWRSR